MHILLLYEHLFYKYFKRQSVGQATKGRNVKIFYKYLFVSLSVRLQNSEMWINENVIFSALKKNRQMIFSVHIPLLYEHLFNRYFQGRSINQATKGWNVKIRIFSRPLIKILFIYFCLLYYLSFLDIRFSSNNSLLMDIVILV